MHIQCRIEFVTGAFDTDSGKLICVKRKKYGEVLLCFKEGLNIPFATIKLHTKDLAIDADAVFQDAANLGDEICRRWNEYAKVMPAASDWEDHPAEHALRDALSRILSETSARLSSGNCTKETKDFAFSKGRGVKFTVKQGDYVVSLACAIMAEIPRDPVTG